MIVQRNLLFSIWQFLDYWFTEWKGRREAFFYKTNIGKYRSALIARRRAAYRSAFMSPYNCIVHENCIVASSWNLTSPVSLSVRLLSMAHSYSSHLGVLKAIPNPRMAPKTSVHRYFVVVVNNDLMIFPKQTRGQPPGLCCKVQKSSIIQLVYSRLA